MPFTWDVTKPAGTDPISQGDDQIRADKDTLRKVLRTLTPFGTATVSWREIQVGDDNYLAHNADYDGTNWNRDSTSLPARAIRYKSTGEVEFLYAAAGANPITWTVQAYVNPSGQIVSNVSTGTAPLSVASTTAVTNLNADMVDGKHASELGGGKPFLPATAANLPASGAATLVRVDATDETWYELAYPDTAVAVADFEIPAKAFTQVRLMWRTPGTTGQVRWVVEVREKASGGALGGGTVVASVVIVAGVPATANALNEATATLSYTPAAGAIAAMLRVYRDPAHAADTLGNEARLITVELL